MLASIAKNPTQEHKFFFISIIMFRRKRDENRIAGTLESGETGGYLPTRNMVPRPWRSEGRKFNPRTHLKTASAQFKIEIWRDGYSHAPFDHNNDPLDLQIRR